MGPAPCEIGGARVLWFTTIDQRLHPTGNCKYIDAGTVQGPVAGLAICQYAGESGYYLFGCNAVWESVTDTWHPTLKDAKKQAEFEYEKASLTWIIAMSSDEPPCTLIAVDTASEWLRSSVAT